jgi:hypothetical protein
MAGMSLYAFPVYKTITDKATETFFFQCGSPFAFIPAIDDSYVCSAFVIYMIIPFVGQSNCCILISHCDFI